MKLLQIQEQVSNLVGVVKGQLSNRSRRVNRVVKVELDVSDIDETGFKFEADRFKKGVVGTYKLEGNYNHENECILFKLVINAELDEKVKTIHYEVFKNDEEVSFRPDVFENDIEGAKAPKIEL